MMTADQGTRGDEDRFARTNPAQISVGGPVTTMARKMERINTGIPSHIDVLQFLSFNTPRPYPVFPILAVESIG
jgi:hypothetical protein